MKCSVWLIQGWDGVYFLVFNPFQFRLYTFLLNFFFAYIVITSSTVLFSTFYEQQITFSNIALQYVLISCFLVVFFWRFRVGSFCIKSPRKPILQYGILCRPLLDQVAYIAKLWYLPLCASRAMLVHTAGVVPCS